MNDAITNPDDIECHVIGDGLTLSTEGIDTSKGSSYVFTLDASKGTGLYNFSFFGKSSENVAAAAQIPVGITINGLSITSVTWNGTEKETVEKQNELVLATKYSVMKLHFVQSGLVLEKIVISKSDKKLDYTLMQ